MPNRRVEIAPAADIELEELLHFSSVSWGLDRALMYIDQLHRMFEQLRSFPELGRARPDIAGRSRSILVGEHVVFYRVLPDLIQITHVLHVREDHLAVLADQSDDQ